MPFEPFHERFPEIAARETRTMTVGDSPDLPADEYGLVEMYCNESGCDCRRVFFTVLARRQQRMVAVIAYGWESLEFYRQWLSFDDPAVVSELKGPVLNLTSPQSEIAPAVLELVRWVLEDREYVERLKRHYRMFRETVDAAPAGTYVDRETPDGGVLRFSLPRKAPRNKPCPCGSGRKYKQCCGRPAGGGTAPA
jgi:hypothetical protein